MVIDFITYLCYTFTIRKRGKVMKVKVLAKVWVEEIIEVDDKYLRVSEYSKVNPNWDYTDIDDETDIIVRLSEQCADFCCDVLAEKYGDKMEYRSVLVYDMDNNVIFEE